MINPRDIQKSTSLFRGISIKSNEWVYGNPIIRKNKYYIATQNNIDFMTITDDGVATLKLIEVYPNTLGAYTTVNDMNDIKVFLGDILENITGPYIPFTHQHRNPVIHSDGNYFANGFCNIETYDFKYCKVIGNVYEHPDLLDYEITGLYERHEEDDLEK